MMAITDETLLAWLDGELDSEAGARVEATLAADPDLRMRLDRQRRLRDRLSAHYAPIAEEPVPPRLRALLEPEIVDLTAARARRARPLWQTFAAIAATLVLGIAIGTQIPGGASGPVVVDGRGMMARGTLADALDHQLAAAQAPDAATRIGVSFARADGQWCRTFDSAAVAGVACRDNGQWRLMMTAPGTLRQGAEYRQAGSESPLVLQAAQELMAGEPLDAAGERRQRDAGWRPAR